MLEAQIVASPIGHSLSPFAAAIVCYGYGRKLMRNNADKALDSALGILNRQARLQNRSTDFGCFSGFSVVHPFSNWVERIFDPR